MVNTSEGNHIIIQEEPVFGVGNAYILGTIDASGGHDWSVGTGAVGAFTIDLDGAGAETIDLTVDCADIDEIVDHIQSVFDAVLGNNKMIVGHNTYFVYFATKLGSSFVLVDGADSPLTDDLGIPAATYSKKMVDNTFANIKGAIVNAGTDWTGAGNADFELILNGRSETVALTADASANIAAAVSELQTQIDAVYTDSEFTVAIYDTDYIQLTSNVKGTFELVDGTNTPLASDLGWYAGEYHGNTIISATMDDITMPFEETLWEDIHLLNMGVSEVKSVKKGHEYEDGSLPLFLQTGKFIDIATSGSRGALLKSFITHWQNALDDLESYGVQISQLEISWGVKEWVKQIIDCFNRETSKDSINTFTTDIDFLDVETIRPLAWYDITTTVDGNDVDIVDAAIRIINETDKENVYYTAKEYRDGAHVDKRIYEVELTFKSEDEALRNLVDIKAATLDVMPIVFVFPFTDGTRTMTLDNMRIKTRSSNVNMLKDGFYEWSATWVMGPNFSFSFPKA